MQRASFKTVVFRNVPRWPIAASSAMKLLIAEDRLATLSALTQLTTHWGYQVIGVSDGGMAWDILQREDAPKLALLDWVLPILDGVEVCRQVRQRFPDHPPHLILITGRGSEDDLIAGLAGGADDYLRKPVSPPELRARLDAGKRIVKLQSNLAERVRNLEKALSRVKQLQGLLPICSYCKKVRDDRNYWRQVEDYISANSEAQFSHGICPDCFTMIVEPELSRFTAELGARTLASAAGAPNPAKLIPTLAPEPQRSAPDCRGSQRFDCCWEVPFRLQHEAGRATVRNISRGGLGLELGRMVEPGRVMTVELDTGSGWQARDARVVHAAATGQDRCRVGGAFLQPLEPAEIQLLLAGADLTATRGMQNSN